MPHGSRDRKRTAAATPAPAEVRAAREAAGHTPKEAAAAIYGTTKAWVEWETDTPGARRIHPAFFQLYQLKTGQVTLEQVRDADAQARAREDRSMGPCNHSTAIKTPAGLECARCGEPLAQRGS